MEIRKIEEEGKRIAELIGNGVVYIGPQLSKGEFLSHFFVDKAVTDTTFAGRTLDEALANLTQKRKDFGAAPLT